VVVFFLFLIWLLLFILFPLFKGRLRIFGDHPDRYNGVQHVVELQAAVLFVQQFDSHAEIAGFFNLLVWSDFPTQWRAHIIHHLFEVEG